MIDSWMEGGVRKNEGLRVVEERAETDTQEALPGEFLQAPWTKRGCRPSASQCTLGPAAVTSVQNIKVARENKS